MNSFSNNVKEMTFKKRQFVSIRFPTRLGCLLHNFVHNIVRMEARRRLHLATLLCGVINTGRPHYLLDKLVWTNTICSYGRRCCTHVFATPQHRTVAFLGSFRFATRCWNDLPPSSESELNLKILY
jgi:hypothetical protein